MAMATQQAFSQTLQVVNTEDDLPETPANLGAIGTRKTLVGGPNMESMDSDVFSSVSRCGCVVSPPVLRLISGCCAAACRWTHAHSPIATGIVPLSSGAPVELLAALTALRAAFVLQQCDDAARER